MLKYFFVLIYQVYANNNQHRIVLFKTDSNKDISNFRVSFKLNYSNLMFNHTNVIWSVLKILLETIKKIFNQYFFSIYWSDSLLE